MNSELLFRTIFAVIGIPIYAIRYYYLGSMVGSGDKVSKSASRTSLLFIWLVSVMATIVPVVYVIAPRWLAWSALPMFPGLRGVGVALGLVSIPLLFWVHRTLGKNFNLPGLIQEKQTLVKEGAYRWVRHPMYTAFALFSLAGFLISANGLVGLVLVAYCLAAFSMINVEEATLIEKFGDPYREYMQSTGRFLPRFR